ncbi:MAG: SDR family NAD(P)-dependent oxidoreductase [Cyclobacteriaceae bacterium]
MKHILITGSTDGIGKLTAIKLAKEGHTIYLHGRNQEKVDKAVEEVKQLSGNEAVSGFLADFSDLTTVSKMADQVNAELDSLDVLINNAGVYNSPAQVNDQGLELRMVVNYLAPYHLTNKLMTLFKRGTRIINLSSAAQAPIDLQILSGRKNAASERDMYAQSKLALIMWSFHLAASEKDCTVIAVNPGSLLHTKMALEAFGNSWSSADKGATILHDLAVSDTYAKSSGKYFDNDQGRFSQAHLEAYDDAKIEALIAVTNKILGVEM